MCDDASVAIKADILSMTPAELTRFVSETLSEKPFRAAQIYGDIRRNVMSHEYLLQIHGFYLDEEHKTIHFDIIIDFAAPDANELYRHILTETQEAYPDYTVSITLDTDVSD